MRTKLESAPRGRAPWLFRALSRITKIVVGLFVGIWLLYVVAANLFFLLDGPEKVTESTEDVKISVRHAWTLWPGRLHGKGLRVRGQDHNVQWMLEVDKVDASVRLTELLKKRFHVTKVRGDGASFRFRHRVAPDMIRHPTTQLLPPIPGYEDPPVLKPPTPTVDPEALWTVHIENVDVPVRELWFQQFRYDGPGRARGKFRLRPALHLWVGPASLDLSGGALRVGSARMADTISGHIDCIVDPFDTRVPVGRQVFRFITTTIEMDGRGITLDPLQAFLPPDAHLSSRGGTLLVAARADHGVFTEQSRLELRSDHVELERRDYRARAEHARVEAHGLPGTKGELRFSLDRGAVGEPSAETPAVELERSMVTARSSSSDTSVEWQIEGGELETERALARDLRRLNRVIRDSGWKFRAGSAAASARARYEKQLANGSAVIELDRAKASSEDGLELSADARGVIDFDRLSPKRKSGTLNLRLDGNQLLIERGTTVLGASGAHVTARGKFSEGKGDGEIHAKIDSLGVKSKTATLTSRARLDLEIRADDAHRQIGELSASGRLDDIRAAFGPTVRAHVDTATLKTKLSTRERNMPEGFVSFVASDITAMDVGKLAECRWAAIDRFAMFAELGPDRLGCRRMALTSELANVRTRWGDFAAQLSPRLTADVDAALFEGKSGPLFVNLDARDVELRSGTGRPKGWDARIPEVSVDAVLRGRADDLAGRVAVTARKVDGRLGNTPVHADLVLRGSATRLDPRGREAIGSLDLAIERAGLRNESIVIDDWWAKARVSSLRISAGENIDLWGKFRAKLRDGQPGLALFSDDGGLPDWVARALPLRDLEAQGEVHRHCQLTDFDFEHVSGGPLIGRARIQSVPDDVRAALVMRLESLAPISAGLAVYEGKTHVRALAGNDWLEEQYVRLDQEAGKTLLGPCKKPPKKCDF